MGTEGKMTWQIQHFSRRCLAFLIVLLAVSLSVGAQTSHLKWFVDPDGKPLPFQSNEEVEAFLRTAEIVSSERLGAGLNNPLRVLLEKDGIRMHAVFRDVHVDQREIKLTDGTKFFFRDDADFECAAYELAKLLGMDTVPPAVERKIRRTEGTLQVFVENAMSNEERRKDKIPAPSEGLEYWRWMMQWQQIQMFDNLIYNEDRNPGNVLISPDGRLWMIDHGRSFRRWKELPHPKLISYIDRNVWEKLQTLDEALVRERLTDYLNPYEMEGLLERRRLLVEHVQKLIDEQGAGKVLFIMR
jgi:hypothetical protein